MFITGRGTSIKGTVMMEHWNLVSEKKIGKVEDILGPTPVKSSLSITSACCELFLLRDLPPRVLSGTMGESSE